MRVGATDTFGHGNVSRYTVHTVSALSCHKPNSIYVGNRFRAAPNVLLFRSRTASDDIYGMKANVKKANFYEAWPRNDRDHHTLNTTDVNLHARKRRILGTAFTNSFTIEAADTVARHVDQWNGILTKGGPTDDGWSVAQDMSTAIDFLVFDVFVDLFFGRCFNTKDPCVEANSYRNIPHFINKLMAFAYPVCSF
jgi:cytochrome P450